jgi:hypothetical protein
MPHYRRWKHWKSKATGISLRRLRALTEPPDVRLSRLRSELNKVRKILRDFPEVLEQLERIRRTNAPLRRHNWKMKEMTREFESQKAAVIEADKKNQGFLRRLLGDETISPEAAATIRQLESKWLKPQEPLRILIEEPRDYYGYSLDANGFKEAKSREASLLGQIAVVEKEQEALRLKYGADERTVAAAAAHFDATRDHAYRIKGGLLGQLDITKDCPYCGLPLGDSTHADHIYPVSRGGLSTIENMVLVCDQCNLSKGDRTLREFIRKNNLDAERIESTLERLGKRF